MAGVVPDGGRDVVEETGPGPMTAVRQFVEAFNADDADLLQAARAEDDGPTGT
jgi:hypothetical protein